jgi:hypothetical protein
MVPSDYPGAPSRARGDKVPKTVVDPVEAVDQVKQHSPEPRLDPVERRRRRRRPGDGRADEPAELVTVGLIDLPWLPHGVSVAADEPRREALVLVVAAVGAVLAQVPRNGDFLENEVPQPLERDRRRR